MTIATPDLTARNDYKVLGLISAGHFLSHFYYMSLPPLFLAMRDAFGVGFAELGAILATMSIASAIVQIPLGFVVDRYGARPVLAIGLAITSALIGAIGLAPSYWVALLLALISGIGNAVFHPADYAILNSTISDRRMGRAFSVHTFAGHLGFAAAPVVMLTLSAWLGWRMALVAVGAAGLVATLVLLTQWSTMHEDLEPGRAKGKPGAAPRSAAGQPGEPAAGAGMALITSWPIMMFFLFFGMLSLIQSGMQSFMVTSLVMLHGTPLASANMALSAFLFCMAAGILIGGEVSDRAQRLDRITTWVFAGSAGVCLMLAWFKLPLAALVVLMTGMGLAQGIVRPARDMMLRAAVPKGSAGKVFGFATTGIAVGSAVAPIPFGWLVDIGRPAWVFYLLAVCMLLSIVTIAPIPTGEAVSDSNGDAVRAPKA